MTRDPFETIPAAQRAAARSALAAVMGGAPIGGIAAVPGGASGAAIFRIEAGGRSLMLRAEGPASPLLRRNPHQYACLRTAAEAGVAPRLRFLDEAGGVVVTDFIEQRPLQSYPGGAPGLVQAVGELVRRLQWTPAFPPLVDYRDLVADMLDHVRASGVFAQGLLDPHVERLAEIRAAYDWAPEGSVSSHNDLHPGNLLFDGVRLWLIDWESAYRNDPLVDVAIVADNLAISPELVDVLLRSWLGRPPDRAVRDRLDLMRQLTRLYYSCFLIHAGAAAARERPDADLSTPSPGALTRAIGAGRLKPGDPGTAHIVGKMFLNGFRTGRLEPGLREAVNAAFP